MHDAYGVRSVQPATISTFTDYALRLPYSLCYNDNPMMRPPRFLRKLLGHSLSCEQVNHFIVEYLDDALPPKTQRTFEQHVRRCPVCAAYLDQYKGTIDLIKTEATLPSPPPELVTMTLAFLDEHLDDDSDS